MPQFIDLSVHIDNNEHSDHPGGAPKVRYMHHKETAGGLARFFEGLQPENVREAAISFGATKWYLLTRVDLPLASPSIRAGINQTIMLSLAMVVVASLIGAKLASA